MSLNYGFTCSLIKFFAVVIMLISLSGICVGVFLLSFPALLLKLLGSFIIVAGGAFFAVSAYVFLRVIIQYEKRGQ